MTYQVPRFKINHFLNGGEQSIASEIKIFASGCTCPCYGTYFTGKKEQRIGCRVLHDEICYLERSSFRGSKKKVPYQSNVRKVSDCPIFKYVVEILTEKGSIDLEDVKIFNDIPKRICD